MAYGAILGQTGGGTGGTGSLLTVTFESVFQGRPYTITSGSESYSGVVPSGLVVEQVVKQTNVDYIVQSSIASGDTYQEIISVGDYFGNYSGTLQDFTATLVVTGEIGASVTAVSDSYTYTGTIGSGGTATLTILHAGNYTVTVELEDETAQGTIDIQNDGETYNINLPFILPVLNDNTWQQIRNASDQGIGENYWAVGDAKQITLNATIGTVDFNNYQTWVYILGFNHNSTLEGNNRIHFGCFRTDQNYTTTNSIALVDNYYNSNTSVQLAYHMNTTNTNTGGWESSIMRTAVIDADATSPSTASANSFLAGLPSDLQAVMKQCTKYTDNTGGGNNTASYVTATTDWAWLLAEFEVQGSRSSANSAEQNYQQQYQYYIDGNSKIKYRHSSTGSTAYWWNRSPNASSSNVFCYVNTDGSPSGDSAYTSYGFAPGFCV